MPISPTRLLPIALVAATLAVPAAAQSYLPQSRMIGGNPGPAHNYICPNADGGRALDCYLDAVRHLYTMCRHVKSIEIIEFGYEASDRGTNSAKSEYCVDKQKLNITRPYQAALREATVSKQAVDGVRGLHELIERIRADYGDPRLQVDILSHSNGGLLAGVADGGFLSLVRGAGGQVDLFRFRRNGGEACEFTGGAHACFGCRSHGAEQQEKCDRGDREKVHDLPLFVLW